MAPWREAAPCPPLPGRLQLQSRWGWAACWRGAALTLCPGWGGRLWAEQREKKCQFLCICSFSSLLLSLGFLLWYSLSISLSSQFLYLSLSISPRVSESEPVSWHGSVHPCSLSQDSFLEAFSLALVDLCQPGSLLFLSPPPCCCHIVGRILGEGQGGT